MAVALTGQRMQRDGRADFCDVDVVSTGEVRGPRARPVVQPQPPRELAVQVAAMPRSVHGPDGCRASQLTAELFHLVYRNKRPVLLRRGKGGPPAWMTPGRDGTEGLFKRNQLVDAIRTHESYRRTTSLAARTASHTLHPKVLGHCARTAD